LTGKSDRLTEESQLHGSPPPGRNVRGPQRRDGRSKWEKLVWGGGWGPKNEAKSPLGELGRKKVINNLGRERLTKEKVKGGNIATKRGVSRREKGIREGDTGGGNQDGESNKN